MAAYPSFAQMPGTRVRPIPRKEVVVAGNGAMRGVITHATQRYEITSVHRLQLTDFNTLRSFYIANETGVIEWTAKEDNTTYTNLELIDREWAAAPGYPNTFEVTVKLRTR